MLNCICGYIIFKKNKELSLLNGIKSTFISFFGRYKNFILDDIHEPMHKVLYFKCQGFPKDSYIQRLVPDVNSVQKWGFGTVTVY